MIKEKPEIQEDKVLLVKMENLVYLESPEHLVNQEKMEITFSRNAYKMVQGEIKVTKDIRAYQEGPEDLDNLAVKGSLVQI